MAKWSHFTSKSHDQIIEFVNKKKPKLDGIESGLSNGRDFHVWVREGDAHGKSYTLNHTDANVEDIKFILESERTTLLGWNVESPPRMWYFEEV